MTVDYALIFKNLGIVGLWLIVIPFSFIALLTYINRNTKHYLANGLGVDSELYLGWLGIFFHETSHLLVALLFGHHITAVRLLKRPHPDRRDANGDPDLTLGYVNHTWNQRNWYQNTGNLFIGIAPIFGCTLVLLGLTALFLPTLFSGIIALTATPLSLDWESFREAIVGASDPWWHWLVMLILAMNISVGGFDLSSADFANSQVGLIGFASVLAAITVVLTLFQSATGWLTGIAAVMVVVSVVLTFSLIVSVLANLLVRLVLQVKWH